MTGLPYHHDWNSCFETSFGVKVKWFGRWGADPDWSIARSYLASDLVCFFYVEQGGCMAEVNGVIQSMQPGELVVLRGADVFSFTQDSSRPQTSMSACLSFERDGATNELMRLSYQRHYRLRDREGYERRFHETIEALNSRSEWRDLYVTAAILRWLAELQEALRPGVGLPPCSPNTVDKVLTAQDWIRQRLNQNISITTWASACGLNADYFSRLFKAHTGLTPKSWLIETRLQRAARLLSGSGRTVAEVADLCGFNCPFHLSRSFKRRFGTAPASYRLLQQIRGFAED
ncbi:MAG: helix-turn-helix domain-containing protein [Chthoniobacterales bacterium]